MSNLIERLRARLTAERAAPETGHNAADRERAELIRLLREAATAIEEAQMGLRYAVQVWVLADEIEWIEAEIDEAVERIIGYAKKEARNE